MKCLECIESSEGMCERCKRNASKEEIANARERAREYEQELGEEPPDKEQAQ